MDGAHIIPPKTSDDEVLRELRGTAARTLLVPFHAHRDAAGVLVNGLEILQRLDDECPAHRESVMFMPISAMGMSSVTLMLSRDTESDGLAEQVRKRTLFMPEEELDRPGMSARVREHSQLHRQLATG